MKNKYLFCCLIFINFYNNTKEIVSLISPIGFVVQGNLFFDKDAKNMRDEIHKLYYKLKDKLIEKDFLVKIANSINDCENSKYILSFWSDCSFVLNLSNNKAKKFFFNFEPPTIRSISYIEQYSNYFDKIFVLYDEIVDNKRYYKFYFPQPNLKMIDDIIAFDEKKLCTMVFSYNESNHKNELYSKRLSILNFFERNYPEDFEFYGIGWPNRYKTYRGPIEHKVQYLKNYKFGICYENSRYSGYITEKIFDVMISGCVPVYFGAPNINSIIPTNCFINRENFDSDLELYKYLKNMTEKEHNQYIENINKFLCSAQSNVFSIDYFINNILLELN